jgi:transposase
MRVEKQSQNLGREDLMRLARSHPDALVDIILGQQKQISALQELVQKLTQHVEALEARLAQNSGNSGKPPSSDGYTKPSPKSQRKKTGRKSGGQKGHPGNTLTPVEKPDFIVVHPLGLCPCGCGANLRKQPLIRRDKRQVFDLPPQKLEVTEHQVEVKRCPNTGREVSASFPSEVKARTQYGRRFNAMLAYLRSQQFIPSERTAQMVMDLFGCSVSEGTIQAALRTAFHALEGFEISVKELIVRAPIAHADESGLRVAKKLHWLHVTSTKTLTWYGVHAKRGGEAIRYFGLLPRFAGRLIHDCFSPYFELTCDHGLCNEHLLRELVFLHEVLHQKWAKSMLVLLKRMHRSVTSSVDRGGPLASIQRAAWTRKYRACLRRGFAQNSTPRKSKGPKRRGRPKHTKAQNLLLRLQEHEAFVLAFLHDYRVPFTNNQGEQDIRMMKVQQKISGCFRTIQGAQIFARIRSYLSTVRKNQRDVFSEMVNLFAGQPFIPSTTD